VEKSVHTGPVNSLFSCTDATAAFASGGADGLVVLWNGGLEPTKKIDVTTLSQPPLSTDIRSVCALQDCVLLGTKASEFFEVNFVTQEVDV